MDNELHSKFTLDIHIIASSFMLFLRSDLQTIQHITVKDIPDEKVFYRLTFNTRLGILNFEIINCVILKQLSVVGKLWWNIFIDT